MIESAEYSIQENIVNIAMIVGRLISEGKIETLCSHSEITNTIIHLAKRFDEEIASTVDYNTTTGSNASRGYWIEIDDFAEKKLTEEFGAEYSPTENYSFEGVDTGVIETCETCD